ncbi:MAG: hypothetical protein ACLTDF_00040 [Coprococcus sp.]
MPIISVRCIAAPLSGTFPEGISYYYENRHGGIIGADPETTRPLDITVLSELPVISTRIDLAMVKVQIIASTTTLHTW